MAQKKPAKKVATKSPTAKGLSAEEKAALKETIADQKAAAAGLAGESALLAKIAAMVEPDRGMAKKIHAIDKAKFKARYATIGFNDTASLDDGELWATAYALKEMTPAVEAKIAALVKKA